VEAHTAQRTPAAAELPPEFVLPEAHVPKAHPLNLKDHLLRLYATERLHRLVPDALAFAAARMVGRVRWLWLPARRRAIGRLSLTVAGTGREREVKKLARRELIMQAMRTEISWRPWSNERYPVIGIEQLDAAVAAGRPIIIANTHVGVGVTTALEAHGHGGFAAVTGDWLAPRDGILPPGYLGYVAHAIRERIRDDDTIVIPIGGAYPVLRDMLERRIKCLLMVDLAGDVPSRMAGKNAYLRTGLVRLAKETGALIVPMVSLFERSGARARVLEPLDAATDVSERELLDRLASMYGDVIAEHPEQLEPLAGVRDIWRDDSAGYPVELWRPPALRRRVRAVAGAARRRARGALRRSA
jgi:hypothetical protein